MSEVWSTILLIICSTLLGSLLTYIYLRYKCFCEGCDIKTAIYGNRTSSSLMQSLHSNSNVNRTVPLPPIPTPISIFHTDTQFNTTTLSNTAIDNI